MAETLKFGPEWLRALADGGHSTTPPVSPNIGPAPIYKLAQYRYGREEMLAFMQGPGLAVPPNLSDHTAVYVEKSQDPMAYINLTEEEQRMMSHSVNSALVLRAMGRPGPERGPLERVPLERGPVSGAFSSSQASTRGIGRPIADRGRGRGRGRGDSYFSRTASAEEGSGEPGVGRGLRPYMRSDSMEERDKRFDRSYPVGRGGLAEDESVPPPRREFSRSMSSDNWRSGDREKTGGALPNDVTADVRTNDRGLDPEDQDDGGGWRRAGSEKMGHKNWRDRAQRLADERCREEQRAAHRLQHRSHTDEEATDGLPEWSTVDIGVGDMVGSFDASGAFLTDGKVTTGADGKPTRMKSAGEALSSAEQSSSPGDAGQESGLSDKNNESGPSFREKAVSAGPSLREKAVSAGPSLPSKERSEATTKEPSPVVSVPLEKTILSEQSDSESRTHTAKYGSESRGKSAVKSPSTNSAQGDRTPVLTKSKSVEAQPKKPEPVVEVTEVHTAEMAAESILPTADDEDCEPPPSSSFQADDEWFYKDPQGQVQGPFANSSMTEWFSAGYFTMNLLVKRRHDAQFHTLGELIKQYGRVPFIRAMSPPSERLEVRNQSHDLPTTVAPSALAHQRGAAVTPSPQPPTMPPQPTQTAPVADTSTVLTQKLMAQIMQQQAYVWQTQMVQQMQQNEKFARLPSSQQQQLLIQLMSQPSPPLMPPQTGVAMNAADPLSMLIRAQQQQSIMTSSTADAMSSRASSLPNTPTTAWTQPYQTQSVWNLAPDQRGKGKDAASLQQAETSRRLDNAVAAQVKAAQEVMLQEDRRKRDEEERRRKDELRLREVERQKEITRQEEEARQRAMERQRELEEEKERERLLDLEQQRELERRREEKEKERRTKEEEDRRRKHEEVERQAKEEARRREEVKLRKQEESRRQEELLRQQTLEEEQKRQNEILRRQDMQRQQELKRHQQDAMKRLQEEQEQFAAKLPTTVRWASMKSAGQNNVTSSLSLAQIQALQEEKEKVELEEAARERSRQQQQQQLQQQQAAEQQYKPTWKSPNSRSGTSAKSLMEIQEEQARQLAESDGRKKILQQVVADQVPLATAAVWGGNHAKWAQEGAWGQAAKRSGAGSFWDEAVTASNKRNTSLASNSNFPALYTNNNNRQAVANNNGHQSAKKQAKHPKDEESVQRIFQQSQIKPTDEFTKWCCDALKGMQSSVDVPTFIAFLQEVDSPFEVHDYVRSYLGETREAKNFAKEFIEKRSHLKNRAKTQSARDKEDLSGPAPAVVPKEYRAVTQQVCQDAVGCDDDTTAIKNKKKKMQKLDASILGFTVHASQNRLNIGEIEKPN